MTTNRLQFKPFVISATEAHAQGVIRFQADKSAIVRDLSGNEFIVLDTQQYDLTQSTIFGLNQRLTNNSNSPLLDETGLTLREKFNDEWEVYSKAIQEVDGQQFNYGYYVYYYETNNLVRYCSPFWHRVVAVASSSKLISDKESKLSWNSIRSIFAKTTIGVAGCSVGSSIIHSAIMDMRPNNIKIADNSLYKMENINRVRLAYWDIVKSNRDKNSLMDLSLRNKAEVVAQQIYAIDPYINVYTYDEGINSENIEGFFAGSEDEPPLDVMIEEVDDLRTKLLIREEARRRALPLIMATDIGSCIQIDIRRFDINNKQSLAYGVSDEELYDTLQLFEDNPTDRKMFFAFVDKLIGVEYRQGELLDIIEARTEIPTATIIPQLGSTVAAAGGIVAEIVARIRLGHEYPQRAIINKNSFQINISN